MVGQRGGGANVFGGGLAVYRNGVRVGGLGVSGDTSCTDHMVAWRVRHALGDAWLIAAEKAFGRFVCGIAVRPQFLNLQSSLSWRSPKRNPDLTFRPPLYLTPST
jgi:Haem degrading protein HbpS-like